jgi:hypothetical protein
MPESLEAVKDRISARYLGIAGIHAVGIKRSENAITIYVDPAQKHAQQRTIQQIRKDAAPYRVLSKEAVPAEFPAG